MPPRYAKRYRIKPRFFIIVSLLAALVLSLLIWGVSALVASMRPPRIQWGRLANDQAITAIVLRDETIVQARQSSKLSCIAAEGEAVQRDQTVAMLYTSGYSEKDLENLTKLQSDIKDYQENNILKNIKNKDLDAINGEITAKMDQISAQTAAGRTQTLLALEKELATFMRSRRELMLEIAKPVDDFLESQYNLETTLQAKIDETRQQVNAPADGLVSFYLDGFESDLSVGAIESMTPEQVKELTALILSKRGSGGGGEVLEASEPVCRIVNPSRWYAVAVLGARENPLAEGITTAVTFDGLKDPVDARVVRVVTSGRSALVVLEMTQGIERMLSLRLINGHIGRDITGYLVPLNTLKEDGGKTLLTYRKPQGGVETVEVMVLAKDAENAVIADGPANPGKLAKGMELVKP